MPNDLEIIVKIEKQIDRRLQPLTELKWDSVGYICRADSIIDLSLYRCGIKDISALEDLTNLMRLYLGGNQITDISALRDLKNLTKLDLSGNEITDISALRYLQNITQLNLTFNQITDISALQDLKVLKQLHLENNEIKDVFALKELKNLTQLHLHSNHITDISTLQNLKALTFLNSENNQITDISALKGLINLTWIKLSSNQIVDISALSDLKKLMHIGLSHNQIVDISALRGLKNLVHLNLLSNEIADISALKDLTNLTELYLSENQIKDISALKDLTNLTQLYLFDNKITDISALKGMTKLTKLGLHHNKITDISAFRNLTNLTWVDLSHNQIKSLPTRILDLNIDLLWMLRKPDKGLNLYGNPLESPPVEIVKQGKDAIRNYFESIKTKETERLYEAKLLIVGQGGVGKTWLKNRLISNEVLQTTSTEGIDTYPWFIDTPLIKKFRINFWDFGGQEIYHATHQFFLTKRSLYLFVWVARADDDLTSFDYWLNVIRLLSDNSPVVVVMNKSDERIKSINEQDITKKFPNVVGFYEVSALKGTGIAELRDRIKKEIARLPLIGDLLPKVWGSIRYKLENLSRNFIPYEEYVEICRGFNLDKKQADFLSRYFHDLGIFIHFADNPLLQQIVFLKPEWATNAVYKVIDTRQIQENHGWFRFDQLRKIWQDYPPDKFVHLLELMKKFEICFELQHQREYIVPEFLRPEKPDFYWDYTDNLRFEYHYDFMPAGIITRFIVRMHHIHKPGLYWKDGGVLEKENTQALIISERLNRKITLRIKGDDKKELLEIIRSEMDYIHQTLNHPDVEQMLPCICPQCRKNPETPYFHRFSCLQNAQEKNIKRIQCLKSFEYISINKLFDEYGIKKTVSCNKPIYKKPEPKSTPKDWLSIIKRIFKVNH